MSNQNKLKSYSFVALFERFITESKKGKRLQANGKRISMGTLNNYICCLKLVQRFCLEKSFELIIKDERKLNGRQKSKEMHYWKGFYKRFTDFLYNDLGFYDNYVGANIRIIKTFFNYLNRDTLIWFGNFHRSFYVRKEEIPVLALLPEELNFLIYDFLFHDSLSNKMKEVKDVFVFGCTVALRVSDLLALRKTAIKKVEQRYYLTVRSKKSGTDTVIKLPEYCINILDRYRNTRGRLLPRFNPSSLNQAIKLLLGKAGFTQLMENRRERRGQVVALKNESMKKGMRFCDLASTHTMRRTAITTMLCLGMPETLVRKISGHSAGSREFYRYVNWAQSYMDQESDRMYERLKERTLISKFHSC